MHNYCIYSQSTEGCVVTEHVADSTGTEEEKLTKTSFPLTAGVSPLN